MNKNKIEKTALKKTLSHFFLIITRAFSYAVSFYNVDKHVSQHLPVNSTCKSKVSETFKWMASNPCQPYTIVFSDLPIINDGFDGMVG